MYLVAGLPTLLFIGSRCMMPESPKWLAAQLRQGKLRGNDKVVNSDAESADQHRTLLNITDAADDSAKVDARRAHPTPGREDLSYLELLKDGDTSWLLLLVCVPWLQSGFLYYGITLSAGSISKEIHLNMFLMGIVEIPGYLAAMYFADTCGRKKTFIGLTMITAFFCLVSWSYPEKGGRLMFALVGKVRIRVKRDLLSMLKRPTFNAKERTDTGISVGIGGQDLCGGRLLSGLGVVPRDVPDKCALSHHSHRLASRPRGFHPGSVRGGDHVGDDGQ